MRTVDAAGLTIGDDHPPRIMGVLNVSQESPYDPSVFDEPGEAATYVDRELIDEGADIVDVGLESANKRFDVLSPAEELERLDTATEMIESTSGDAVFSIETRYHEVAEEALARGFEMVNDICGFADPEMPRVCREYDVAVCKMASPPDLKRPGAIEDVEDIYDALFQNGLTEKTIVDPAFGGWSEAKTLADDRETFRRLREFRAIGQPILVSINRKNFLRTLADRDTEEALPVSLAATAMAVERGAHVIRTHDVAETRDAAIVGKTFSPERLRTSESETGVAVEELDVTTAAQARRHVEHLDGEERRSPLDDEGRESSPDGKRIGSPETAVGRMYKLRGLSGTASQRLRTAARERDVLVAGRGEELIVAGSLSALGDLARDIEGSSELVSTLERLYEGAR